MTQKSSPIIKTKDNSNRKQLTVHAYKKKSRTYIILNRKHCYHLN